VFEINAVSRLKSGQCGSGLARECDVSENNDVD